MDYRYLDAFLAVGSELNFTLAARRLNISQSAISRQIKLLEESIGYQVVIRSPQKVSLTPRGSELFLQCHGFNQWVQGFNENESLRPLKIGTYQGFLENCLVDILAKHYRNKEHGVEVTLIGPRSVEELITKGEIDLALSGIPIDNENFSSMKVLKENIVLISKERVDLSKIYEYPWIICHEKDYIVNYSKRSPKRKILVQSVRAQLELVDKGLGISMLPEHLIPQGYKLKKQPVKKFSNEYMYLTTFNYQMVPKRIKEFSNLLKNIF